MPKFTFICEHENFDGVQESKTVLETNKEYLYDVIEEFERFLKGSGFVFDGQLEFVNTENESTSDPFEINIDTHSSAVWPFPETTLGDSDFVVAGSVNDIGSLDPINLDTMAGDFSISSEDLYGVQFHSNGGNGEDVIHFRV